MILVQVLTHPRVLWHELIHLADERQAQKLVMSQALELTKVIQIGHLDSDMR